MEVERENLSVFNRRSRLRFLYLFDGEFQNSSILSALIVSFESPKIAKH